MKPAADQEGSAVSDALDGDAREVTRQDLLPVDE